MLAVDVALHADAPPDTVIALSGAIRGGDAWPSALPRSRRLRVFLSHGREDAPVPFVLGRRLHERLLSLGADVTFVAFDGGHGPPPDFPRQLAAFLRAGSR